MGKVWKPVELGTHEICDRNGEVTGHLTVTPLKTEFMSVTDEYFVLPHGVTFRLCRLVPDEGGVPSVVWAVYGTDGYHPSNVAYFTSEDEAKKCAEWSRADEVKRYQEIGLEESYVDDYGVYSMPLNTTFDAWLTQQQKGGE